MPLIRTASTEVTSIDEARQMATELVDQEQASAFRSGRAAEVSCRAGCTACCVQSVPVGPAELRAIAAAIDKLDTEVKAKVQSRIARHAALLRHKGFTARDLQDRDRDERRDVAVRYFAAGVTCPLLDGDTCVVRDARPLICRDYLVTSDPKECESITSGKTVRVRFGRNVIGGFKTLERNIGDDESLILALALDGEIPESPPIPMMSTSACVTALTPR